jgi:hypothetical protein
VLQKLKYYGIHSKVLGLFKSHVANSKQTVELKSHSIQKYLPKWEILKHDVPQGSVLEPPIFIV